MRAALLAGLFLLCTVAAALARPPAHGVHGMAVFGGSDGLFAAHLPMFHAPHDAQVLLALRLTDPALDAAMRATLAASPRLWTLVPEPFDLDRLEDEAPSPLRRLRADLVEGHFERGGQVRHRDVEVEIVSVLLHRHLDPVARQSELARYVVLGAGSTRAAVKRIDARPDFDHIVVFDCAALPVGSEPTLPWREHEAAMTAALAEALAPRCPASAAVSVYFETDDLR